MSNVIALTIDGAPKPQMRPRFSMKSNFGHVYDPSSLIKKKIRKQISLQFTECLTCPVALSITFYMPIPKSTSKKSHKQMLEPSSKHTKKPDIDNLYKLITDAMNGIVYHDDSQIYLVTCEKTYSDNPRTEIFVIWH